MIVDCAVYEQGRRAAGELALADAYEAGRRHGAFVWLGLYQPSEQEFDSVRREFDLHELAVEDAIRAHQRPKLEVYGDSLFFVLKSARWEPEDDRIDSAEILIFVGDGFLISVRHGETKLHDVRLALEARPDLLALGPSAALHAIVDRVVDDYEPVVEALDDEIREVEAEVFSGNRSNPAERIYRLKRAVLELYAAVAPLQEAVYQIAAGRHPLIEPEMHAYFRDIDDHLRRVVGRVHGFRELLTNVLAANLTQVSVRQNEDVRRISAWAAIIAVPTMIAGIYGMNFEHMPELGWRFGYPLALAAIAVACVGLWAYFHRVGWL
jgi:magnesium transporter